jgi:hypothetical protein
MVERRIKPYREQVAEAERREKQQWAFRRDVWIAYCGGGDSGLVAFPYPNQSQVDIPAGWWRL